VILVIAGSLESERRRNFEQQRFHQHRQAHFVRKRQRNAWLF